MGEGFTEKKCLEPLTENMHASLKRVAVGCAAAMELKSHGKVTEGRSGQRSRSARQEPQVFDCLPHT